MNVLLKNSILWAAILLLTAEAVVRLGWQQNMSGRFDYGYHPTAGFVEDGDTLRLVRAGGRRFRPQQLKIARPAGMTRIFVLGDSVPRGGSLGSAYPWRTAEFLQERGVKAESYNLGIAGFGVRRVQLMLKQALKYQPTFIVLHVNSSNEYEDEREWTRRNAFSGWHPRFWLMKSLLLRRLHEAKTEKIFWELLPLPVRSQGMVNDADAEVGAMIDEKVTAEWNQRVATVTRESVALARAAGIPLVLVSQVRWERGTENMIDPDKVEDLCESLAGEGVIHVSMRKELSTGTELAKLFADGAHMHGAAHDLIAKAIVARVTEDWIPATSSLPAK